MEPLLRVRALVTLLGPPGRRVRAVDGVSFDVAHGEVFGLVGEQPSPTQPHGAARQIYQPRPLTAPALIIPSPSYATSYRPQVATAASTARMHDCALIQRNWYCHSYKN